MADESPLSAFFSAPAKGLTTIMNQINVAGQTIMNSHMQAIQTFSRMAQQAQTNITNSISSAFNNLGVQAAKPLVGIQQVSQGAGIPPLPMFGQQQKREAEPEERPATVINPATAHGYQTGYTSEYHPLSEEGQQLGRHAFIQGYTKAPVEIKSGVKTTMY